MICIGDALVGGDYFSEQGGMGEKALLATLSAGAAEGDIAMAAAFSQRVGSKEVYL